MLLNGLLGLPLLWSVIVAAARVLITSWSAALTILPKTVKPPFCLSRLDELSARLKKNWSVALLGSLPTFAIAIVPIVLDVPNSFCTAGPVGMAGRLELAALKVKPPPCSTKFDTRRWKML